MSLLRRLEEQAEEQNDKNDDQTEQALIIAGVVVVIIILVVVLVCCCKKAIRTKEPAPPEEEEPKLAVSEDSATKTDNDSGEDEVVEKDVEEEAGPSFMTTCDVHTCTSVSCEICRNEAEPKFLSVNKDGITTGLRIKGLPYRWWENSFDDKAIKEKFDKECKEDQKVYSDDANGPLYNL